MTLGRFLSKSSGVFVHEKVTAANLGARNSLWQFLEKANISQDGNHDNLLAGKKRRHSSRTQGLQLAGMLPSRTTRLQRLQQTSHVGSLGTVMRLTISHPPLGCNRGPQKKAYNCVIFRLLFGRLRLPP
jgi:hypothetical protein